MQASPLNFFTKAQYAFGRLRTCGVFAYDWKGMLP